MTTFDDGPAQGQTLEHGRHPYFLRVTKNRLSGAWDVLDQLHDRPTADEEIHVYRRVGQPLRGFWDGTKGGKRTGGIFVAARYRYHLPQPTDDQIRETDAWRSWTQSETEKGPRFP